MCRPTTALLILSIATALLEAADTVPRWRSLNQAARAAVEAKDYAKLRDVLLELQPLLPGNPRIAYNLAATEARLGNRDAAFAALRNWAVMGLVYDVAADDDFSKLRDSAEFAAILKQAEAHKQPAARAVAAFPVAGRDLLPEDIAYDRKTRRFLVSSVRQGTIVTVDGKPFARADWSVFALRVDDRRRLLWATTGWVPHCENCQAADEGKTALLAFDLDTGVQKHRIESPEKGLLGDMTIGRDGDIYVSEGIHGAVFHLRQGAQQLERLDVAGEFPSPQTPALSADEKTLFVPDYVRGIGAIDLASHHVKWLQPAPGLALSGIDGLYVRGDWFLAVQNGTTPPRLIRFSLDLKQQQLLEANTPSLGDPTHGVFVGDVFYFIANSGWGEYDRQGKKKRGSAAIASEVRKIILGK